MSLKVAVPGPYGGRRGGRHDSRFVQGTAGLLIDQFLSRYGKWGSISIALRYDRHARWSNPIACQAHNLEVIRSNQSLRKVLRLIAELQRDMTTIDGPGLNRR